MTEKWTNFAILFSAMLDKNGTNLPSENDMHSLLESIKEAENDDIEHSDASLQEKHRAKSFNEDLQQMLEQIYHQEVNKHR